jgi:hypothetical protein
MKLYAYACLILGAAAISLRSTEDIEAEVDTQIDAQAMTELEIGMMIASSEDEDLLESGDNDGKAFVRVFIQNLMYAVEEKKGAVTFSEVKKMIKANWKDVFDSVLEYFKNYKGASAA